MLNNFFTSVVASREPPEKEKMPSTITCFTASSDQTIREVNINPDPDETRDLAKFPFLIRDLTIKMDESNNYFYSQLLLFNGKRAFFAGTGNNKDDKAPSSYKEEKIPSALHVLSYESYGSSNNFIRLFEV